MNTPAAFFDRDGTLIKNVPYSGDPEAVELLPGAAAALSRIKRLGFAIVIVSNQSGVARGLITENDVRLVNDRMRELIRAGGGPEFDGIYYCPHHPDGVVSEYTICCDCRKPADGLIRRARADLNLDAGRSYIVGDNYEADMMLGAALKMKPIYLRPEMDGEIPPGVFAVARSLEAVADIIEADSAAR